MEQMKEIQWVGDNEYPNAIFDLPLPRTSDEWVASWSDDGGSSGVDIFIAVGII